MADTTTSFLTIQTIASYGGASIAVMAVSNTLRMAFGINKPWIPFVISIIVAYAGIYLANDTITLKNGIISFFNGCLLFTSAAGINHGLIAITEGRPAGDSTLQGKGNVDWLSRWI